MAGTIRPSRSWGEDLWGPGEKRPYPASMILLETSFARRVDDAHAYQEVVVPFLERVIKEFPVGGYPAAAPAPPLSTLLEEWTHRRSLRRSVRAVYRRTASDKTLLIEFRDVKTSGRRVD